MVRYGAAVAFTAAMLILRWIASPLLGANLPFPTLYAAVALAVWFGGIGPALLATALGYLAAYVFFLVPQAAFAPFTPLGTAAIAAYLVPCLCIIAMGYALRRARSAAEASVRTVQRTAEDRRRGEDALRASEERFRTMAELVPCCVWTAAPDGGYTYANQRWHEFTGLGPKETTGFGWASVLHPEDRAHCLAAWHRATEVEDRYHIEVRVRRFDGEYRWLLSEAVPIRDEGGVVRTWFGTSTDITDQKTTLESLREADQRKNEFLAILGHEIRNPLAVIANSCRILEQTGMDDAELTRTRERIDRQVTHLTRIIDDLLDVSRVVEGKIRLRQEPVAIDAIVESAVEFASPFLQGRGVSVRAVPSEKPLWIRADVTRMTQVVGNLLHNAAKFSDRGSTVSLTARRERESAVVSVRDFGAGIAPEVLPRIFDPFVQGDQALQRSRGGLGIGLTLARRLVELHGGSIEARSEGPGTGCEFVVRVPAIEPPLERARPVEEDQAAAASGLRVLVVDDNPDSAQSLALILSLAGHDVRAALDGAQAKRVAAEFRPDLVLLDIGMPGEDGYAVARWMREEARLDARLVAVTGYGQEEDRRHAFEAGFDDHMVKPMDAGALNALIESTRLSRESRLAGRDATPENGGRSAS